MGRVRNLQPSAGSRETGDIIVGGDQVVTEKTHDHQQVALTPCHSLPERKPA